MTPPNAPGRLIRRLSEVADAYDALLCDAWGVIHDGVRLFDGVEEALVEFRRRRGPVVIVTNAPRPSSIIPAQLRRIGLSDDAYDAIVTSGDATRAAIERVLPGAIFKLGPDKDEALYEGMTVTFAPIEKADAIVCTGLFDDERETPDDYATMLTDAATRGLVMICANPDIVVRYGGRLIYCAGALAQSYERLGGKVVYGGKPHAPIYDLAMRRVEAAAGRTMARARVLAVGDGLNTDIAGAARNGVAAFYIAGAGGVHVGDGDAASIAQALRRAGLTAAYYSTELVW